MKFLFWYGLLIIGTFLFVFLAVYLARYSEKKEKGYNMADIMQFSEEDKNYINYLIDKPLFPFITEKEAKEVMGIIRIGRDYGSTPAINRLYEYMKVYRNERPSHKCAIFSSIVVLMQQQNIISNQEASTMIDSYFKKENLQ